MEKTYVYLVFEDCTDSFRCVACFGSEKEAKDFCFLRNTSRPYLFWFEEWFVGEVRKS